MMNFTQKRTQLALVSALLFYIISSPQVYALTNRLPLIKGRLVKGECASCPSYTGQAIHSLVFFLVVLYVMPMVRDMLK